MEWRDASRFKIFHGEIEERSEARIVLYEKEKKIKYVLSMHCVLLPVQNTPITIFISLLSLQTITNMTVEKSIYV